MKYSDKMRRAIKFAAKTHNHYQQQKRKGKEIPYITHPLTVGIILSQAGASEDVVVAGILHDTVEDSANHRKVTPEMLAERFGEGAADLVMSVTETDKGLSWERRKAQALEHVGHFSLDSLLVKSADVLSNVTELIDDHARYDDEVFARFHASKEATIENQVKLVGAILDRWPENPLADDLRAAAEGLERIAASDRRELVVLVDENDNALGVVPKSSVHGPETPLHRAFSLFLFRKSDGKLLLQQRSHEKKTWPLVWSNSVCGHPGPGEERIDAAVRRLDRELGMKADTIRFAVPYRYRFTRDGVTENEICPVFVGIASTEPNPAHDEVEATRWVGWDEFLAEIREHPGTYSEWCEEEALLLEENGAVRELLASMEDEEGSENGQLLPFRIG